MVLTITQFGGGWGSYAGDCCLIQWNSGEDEKSHILIDLGQGSMMKTMQNKCNKSTLKGVILTHLHSDHIGGKSVGNKEKSGISSELEKTLKKLAKNKGFIVLPEFTKFNDTKSKIIKKYSIPLIYDNSVDKKWKNSSYNDHTNKISFQIECIYPNLSQAYEQRENCHSLGCLITVTHNGSFWRMLTLGDMENVDETNNLTASNAIQKVVGQNRIDVIKLAHHGSENNLMNEVQQIIDEQNSKVIISGYTGGEIQKLAKHTGKAEKVCFLFSNAEVTNFKKSAANIQSFIYQDVYSSQKTQATSLTTNFNGKMNALTEVTWTFSIDKKGKLEARGSGRSLYSENKRKQSSGEQMEQVRSEVIKAKMSDATE